MYGAQYIKKKWMVSLFSFLLYIPLKFSPVLARVFIYDNVTASLLEIKQWSQKRVESETFPTGILIKISNIEIYSQIIESAFFYSHCVPVGPFYHNYIFITMILVFDCQYYVRFFCRHIYWQSQYHLQRLSLPQKQKPRKTTISLWEYIHLFKDLQSIV